MLTQHNDIMRTGAYRSEQTLTPRAVDPATGPGMALRYWRPVDGNLDAQLLYAPRVRIGPRRKDLVFAFTSRNTAYAFDFREERDPGTTRGLIWTRTMPATATLAMPMGIYSTPVIDLAKKAVYLVYGINNRPGPMDGVGDAGYAAEFHLAALDIRSGAVLRDVVISGSVPSVVAPSPVAFLARRQVQRAGLLMTRNPLDAHQRTVYVAFGSRWREETHNWHGWVIGYDVATFAPRGAFCSTPDRRANSEGGGIWQGGAGIAADSAGNVYFNTGNGPGTGNDHGNSIVKLTPVRSSSGAYSFTVTAFDAAADDPAHTIEWRDNDIDLAGGGVTVIPGSSQLAGGGKTGVMYLMDRAAMTKVQSFEAFSNTYDPTRRYNDWMSGPHMHGAPTYWQLSANLGYVYHWGEKDRLKRFDHDRVTWRLGATSAVSGDVVATSTLMPGGLISLSANGNRDGLLWITLPAPAGGRVFAYDALTMRRLWETTQSAGVSHSNPPTIAKGRVLVGATNGEFLVYRLNRLRLPPPIHIRYKPDLPIPPDPGPWIRDLMNSLPAERAAALAPPRGHRPLFVALGKGTLAYEPRPAPDGATVEWALVGMTGPLIDQSGVMPNMGRSGLGQVVATADHSLALTDAHDGGRASLSLAASVDAPHVGDATWVLFRSTAENEQGLLDAVTYVQRLGTKGGAPPPAVREAGTRVEVPYEATYAFYVAEKKSQ